MTPSAGFYFVSLLLTCGLSGYLALYAWRHRRAPGARAYARLALSECIWALVEILSVLSPAASWALFWFQVRYLVGAFIGVFWLVFALEYSGRRAWLSNRLLAGLFIIPLLTQVLLWSNRRHGLWALREVTFTHTGPFWLADATARIPGLGYLTHSFYTMLLTLAGIALLLLTAWKLRRELGHQALLLAGAGLIALFFVLNSLFNLLPKTDFNPFTPGLGLSLLLIALAFFRFQFLRRAPATTAPPAAYPETAEKRTLGPLLLIYLLLASGLAASAYLSYANDERQVRTQVDKQLAAITELKVVGLQDWRAERLGDAESLRRNPAFAALVQAHLEHPAEPETAARLQAWLDSLYATHRYNRVLLLDATGAERLAAPQPPEPVAAHLAEDTAAVLASGQVTFVDFHRNNASPQIHLAVLAPLYAPDATRRPLGAVALRTLPEETLYPYLQQWPAPSETAETLLVRRDGGFALFLTPLRFLPDAALNLRIPLTNTQVLAAKAVSGQSGPLTGIDYRGAAVIGHARAVPDSPWLLVTRMDVSEVYAPLAARLWQTIALYSALLVAAGAALLVVWRQQRMRYYQDRITALDALYDSEERFRSTFEQSAVGVAHIAPEGRFVRINQRFCDITGYTQAELVALRFQDITHPDDLEAGLDYARQVLEGKLASYHIEKRYIRKDGSPVWVELTVSFVRRPASETSYFVAIVQDITARKQIEAALRESRALLQAALDQSPAGIAIADAPDGRLRYVNDAGLLIRGGDHKAVVEGIGVDAYVASWQILDLDGTPLETADVPLARAILYGETSSREFIIRRTDDDDRVVLANAAPITDDAGKVISAIVVFSDITERRRIEEALAASQQLLQDLTDNSISLIYALDEEGRFLLINRQLEAVLGVPRETLIGKARTAILPAAIAEAHRANDLLVLQGREPIAVEEENEETDGRHVYFTTKFPLRDHTGAVYGVAGISTDITAQKQVEAALSETNAYLENLFNYANAPIIVWDPQFRITRFNRAFEALTGRRAAEVIGQSLELLFPPEQVHDSMALIRKTLTGVRWETVEIGIQHVGGAVRTVLWNSATLFTADGRTPIATIAQGQDITERKLAEDLLQARLNLFEYAERHSLEEVLTQTLDEVCLLTHSPIGFYHFVDEAEQTLTLQAWSTRTKQAYCQAEGAGLHYPIAEAGVWVDCVRQRGPVIHNDYASLPHRKGLPEGHAPLIRELVTPILRQGKIVAILGVGNKAQDYTESDLDVVHYFADVAWEIAERKQIQKALQDYNARLEAAVEARTQELRATQEKLLRQERLATLGQLAGSVGHELRNPLAIIGNAVYFLQLIQPDAGAKVQEYLGIIAYEVGNAERIIGDLLDFARVKAVDRKSFPVQALVDDVLAHFPPPESVRLVVEAPADLPPIYADPRQMRQVLGNLVANACQAMPGGGELTISAQQSAGGEPAAIAISVCDTGMGIPPENLDKLFEPLFTTKPKGIGLGLPVSQRLIEANDGRIEVTSEVGAGSTFTIYLPVG